jgi:hypothetical protein
VFFFLACDFAIGVGGCGDGDEKGVAQIKVEVIKIMLVYVLKCCVCRLCC